VNREKPPGSERTKINGFIPISFNEVPGRAVAVIFTGGCNFRCPWCQNRDLVLNPETLPKISEDEVFAAVERRRKWLDGIAITGGEPTLQPDLQEFCLRAKQKGLQVVLETNGSNPEVLQDLINQELLDYVAMDVKAPLVCERYKELVGVEDERFFEPVLKSVELLLCAPVDYEFRTTMVPTLNSEDIIEIANRVKGAKKYALQQFVPQTTIDPSFEKMPPWPKEAIERARKAISGMFKSFEIRNI